jgi:LRR receptor-like serine/threonine-protein kinase FLS2
LDIYEISWKLDLSSNSLSGTIPVILNKLTEILYLNLSFNNLKGEISKGEFSTNQTIIISLIGNPGLCGPQVFSLPACPAPRSHFDVLRKVVLPIVGAIGFILCCLLLGFLSRGNLHIQNFDFPRVISHKSEHQSISYQELYRATNGFIEANLLGKGNFGSVYKGILSDGMLVAVKVFNLQNDQVVKSFKTECNILKNVRHRNLVRIITSCSNLHFKGLVFKFMDNGSLEEHLYPDKDDKNVEDVCDLGLKTRLDIAIDVAHAMEYLHHDSLVHVVHCDIKPSNVLLDANMFGLVTDFGIAKLIGATSNDSHTSTLALKGSMGYIAPGMKILKHYLYLYFFHNNFIWICRVNFDQVCLECRVRIG